ncbi:MAG: sigma-54 dependent transcriptional regulator [Planctomycetota bacterium]|nr:sigma-54 dependent transcriptional regulator [Planctomycetota bacterium]
MELVGQSTAFVDLLRRVERVSRSEVTVLLEGEPGTGKDAIARRIHRASARRRGRFVVVDCRALPGGLIESELFGHCRGAFTGATCSRAGRLERADGGTLYLDGVDELSRHAQSRFLRAIDAKEFLPLGGHGPRRADFRLIAAASTDLGERVRRGLFREDLYYRLRVVELKLPPLRERRGDVPALARAFLKALARSCGKPACCFSPAAMRRLEKYSWPGNLHELRGLVEAALAAAVGETVEETDLPLKVRAPLPPAKSPTVEAERPEPTFRERVTAYQRRLLLDALGRHGWDLARTARSLGLHRHQLRYLCSKLGIRRPRLPGDGR